MSARDDVVREIAAAILEPEELLAAFAGDPAPDVYRGHYGWLCGSDGSYLLGDDGVVDVDGWKGVTARIPLADLAACAAAVGTPHAVARLRAAIADRPRAMKAAERYLRDHDDPHTVGLPHLDRQEWHALRDRLWGVHTARHLWWHPEDAVDGPAGEQLDLFAAVPG